MSNSTINTARQILERSDTTETKNRVDEKVNWFTSALNEMGLTSEYTNDALDRISTVENESELDEAIQREMVKAELIVGASSNITEDDDEEDAEGKGSKDAEGKGVVLNKPVKTGDAKKTLDDKKKGRTVEHLEALFSGEDLTDSFKRKTASIFEAAVNARVEEIQAELIRQSRDVVVEEVLGIKGKLTNQLDDYLNYVVSEWMSENELAVDRGIQNEISESFMDGLKGLFESHYIEVPGSKIDLVDELADKCEQLTSKLNETLHENVNLSKANTQSNCESIFESLCHDLADTEVEKFKSLARGVEYNSEEEFANKLSIIKESYFNRSPQPQVLLNETVDVPSYDETEGLTDRMSTYFNAVGRLAEADENNTQS